MKHNLHHEIILNEIKNNSGVPTRHTFVHGYLGNTHKRYSINAPKLRAIAKHWAKTNRDLSATEFCEVIDSLIEAQSSTEKMMGGVLMDYATASQRKFNV